MSSRRTIRVAHLLQQGLSSVLRQKVSDPRLEGLELKRVALSPDLKQARVFYVSPEKANREGVQTALEKATPFLRKQISQMDLRHVPTLSFSYDEKGQAAESVLNLIHNLGVTPDSGESRPPC